MGDGNFGIPEYSEYCEIAVRFVVFCALHTLYVLHRDNLE